jgi:hypothetical protein
VAIRSPESRRWLIGVAISIVFGVFGAVMALLSYAHRTAAPDGAAAPAPSPAAAGDDNASRGRGRKHR